MNVQDVISEMNRELADESALFSMASVRRWRDALTSTPPHDTGTERGEAVACCYRLQTGEPRRKWQWMDGLPCSGTLRLAQDRGYTIEYAFTHPPMQASEGADSAWDWWLSHPGFHDASREAVMFAAWGAARATQELSR